MSLANLVRSLAAAGASPEAIAIAVEAVEAVEGEAAEKRRVARDKKRQQRAASKDGPETVPGQGEDSPDADPLPLSLSPQTPLTHTPAPVGMATRTRKADPEFEVWYEGYPHKIGRGDAEKVWPKARQLASLAELIEGRDRYVLTKPPDKPWCNPSTWLNQKRWLDRPAPENPTGPHERNHQSASNRAASRGDWAEILAERDGPPTRDLARA